MKHLTLLTPEKALLEKELFRFLGLTDVLVDELIHLKHDTATVSGLTDFMNHFGIWDDIEGLTFCLVPFDDIRRVMLKGGVIEDDESYGFIEGSMHILTDGTPVMFLNKETFSLSVFKHELVHFRQIMDGLDTRIGLDRFWLDVKKPPYFSASRTQEEQYAYPWELEAYATMYDDVSLEREHDKVLSYIEQDIEHDVVNAMRTFYRMIIIPYGRKLPFEVKILDK
jgi:hypothetical protein